MDAASYTHHLEGNHDVMHSKLDPRLRGDDDPGQAWQTRGPGTMSSAEREHAIDTFRKPRLAGLAALLALADTRTRLRTGHRRSRARRQQGRRRVAAGLLGAGDLHDAAGARAVLRRPGAQQERAVGADADACWCSRWWRCCGRLYGYSLAFTRGQRRSSAASTACSRRGSMPRRWARPSPRASTSRSWCSSCSRARSPASPAR